MSEYYLYQSAGRREVDGGTLETYVPVSRYQIAREVVDEYLEENEYLDDFGYWLSQQEEK